MPVSAAAHPQATADTSGFDGAIATLDARIASLYSVPSVSNTAVWQTWNYDYYTTTTTAGTTTCMPVITTAFTANEAVWFQWNTTYASTGIVYQRYVPAGWTVWNTAYEENAEQRAERETREAAARAEQEQRAAAQRAQAEEYRQQRAAAKARAEELLFSMLTPEQAQSYRDHGWFEVRGNKGGRWRIRNRGQSGNVDLMPEIGEERDMSFCAHPPGGLPDADAHLAQMLHIMNDEEGFRAVANVQYRRPAAPAAELARLRAGIARDELARLRAGIEGLARAA